MDKDRKKELMEQYKNTRSSMGIFIIRSKNSNKCYVQSTKDLRGVMNGTLMKLNAGIHTNRELQNTWRAMGPDNFTIEILEHLDYDADESKTDYTEDLELLQLMWEEKLKKENMEFYKKRP